MERTLGLGMEKLKRSFILSEIEMTPLWNGNNNTYYISLQSLGSNSLYIIKMSVICIKNKDIKINFTTIAILKSRQHNSWINFDEAAKFQWKNLTLKISEYGWAKLGEYHKGNIKWHDLEVSSPEYCYLIIANNYINFIISILSITL